LRSRSCCLELLCVDLAAKSQQEEVAPARAPGTPVRLRLPRDPDLAAGRTIPVAARIVLLSRGGGHGGDGGVARVIVRIAVGQETRSLAGRSDAFSKDRVVQGHHVPDGFQPARADDEPGVEHKIEGLGSFLDRVRRNDQVFVAAQQAVFVGGRSTGTRICQYAAQRTSVDRIRGRSGRLRCFGGCRNPMLLEGLGSGDCIVSNSLVSYPFYDGRQLRQIKVIGDVISRKRQQAVYISKSQITLSEWFGRYLVPRKIELNQLFLIDLASASYWSLLS